VRALVPLLVALVASLVSAQSSEKRDEAQQLAKILDVDVVLRGEYLRAWETALRPFRNHAGIPAEGKKLDFYYVVFKETAEQYVVSFVPRVDAHGRGLEERGGEGHGNKSPQKRLRSGV